MGDTCTVQQVGKQAEMGRATVNNAGWAKMFYGGMGQGQGSDGARGEDAGHQSVSVWVRGTMQAQQTRT